MIDQLSDLVGHDVSRETWQRLEQFAALLIAENERQNLIAAASVPEIWTRHIFDGAQLYGLAGQKGRWLDIGSGPGLPGMVIAILGGVPMTLNEPRRLRADFLRSVVAKLGLDEVTIAQRKVEKLAGRFDLITARAVAPLDRLLGAAWHLSHSESKWILPKGQKAQTELDEARRTWQGEFRLVPSRTHPASAIILASHVQRRGKQR